MIKTSGAIISYTLFALISVMWPYILNGYPTIIKLAPIALLLCVVLFSHSSVNRAGPIVAALMFSGMGDVLLNQSFVFSFELGLASFLIAHLCYIQRFRPFIPLKNTASLTAIGALGVIISIILPEVPSTMLIPVCAYMAVITVMLITAIHSSESNRSLVCGAALFVLSDSLIAINKFVIPLPLEHAAIMTTYYLAQFLIILGLCSKAGAQSVKEK